MLGRLRDGPKTFARLRCQPAFFQARTTTTESKAASMLKATTDVAKQLEETGIWKRTGGRKKAGVMKAVEPRRVNIVSEQLCDDIIKYIGPSLERHRGCDLVDLNPGTGLWSRALHKFLEPRNHVMMDPDAELYKPFLEDLLSKEHVQMIPKSGIVWKDLLEMIHSHLSHHPEHPKGTPPTRNDTLLVTANLSTFPKKAFLNFDSVSVMVLYQFLSSIRTSSLFQRYGLIRMLVWINDEDKRRLLPKAIQRRKRYSFEAEISCDWIHEVASPDVEVQDRFVLRDEWMNIESGYKTLERMMTQGIEMPRGRENKTYKESMASPGLLGQKLAGVRPPTFTRPFKQELEDLENELAHSGEEVSKRLKHLRARKKSVYAESLNYLELLQEREAIMQMSISSPDQFALADAAWNEKIDNMKKNPRNEFNVLKDSYHIFRQEPSALLWDRRAYEPLSVKDDEFFPNAPTALLDIQPKAMHPLLLQYGPNSNRAGDMGEIILRFWFQQTLLPLQKAMDGLWAGFGDLITECPSVWDVNRGGSPMTGSGGLTVRAMNEAQWIDTLQAFTDWPFRPTYSQLLGRMVDESDEFDEEDAKSSATGMGF